MPYATADDVRVLIPKASLEPEETELIEARIGQTERIILRRIPDLADRITAGDLSDDDVRDVVTAAVLRVVRNPEGFIQESDGTYTYMLDRSTISSDIEITDDEWEILGDDDAASGIGWLVPVIRAPA
ncbi:hypothetical protein HUN08_12600 [Gordonia sp. X0973]|uniref:Gp19/Gp15/Gp42 family protein n=1 Tax=Gordonia sp. X0973 TaxID=2742602 RepID=UPI000F54A8A7|nr:Gp19/Gp15/Gp42 family protein [Gordonia sp. X0973]QKT07933.1 hypothetical protein HUN08_12600 [Gordonia sp. X0973]